MSTNQRTRKSLRLLLYGIVFRILCSVALHAGDRKPIRAPRQPDSRRSPRREERSPLSLNLDPGQ